MCAGMSCVRVPIVIDYACVVYIYHILDCLCTTLSTELVSQTLTWLRRSLTDGSTLHIVSSGIPVDGVRIVLTVPENFLVYFRNW